MMNPQAVSRKKIQQLRIQFPSLYPPYKYITPYTLLDELNKLCKSKYDMQFVHVKYNNKNTQQKNWEAYYTSQQSFHIDRNYNNIFSRQKLKDEQFKSLTNFIFKQSYLLQSPKDIDPQQSIKQTQNKRLLSIQQKIKTIMKIVNEDRIDKLQNEIRGTTRNISSFKIIVDKQYKDVQNDIYAWAILNKTVYDQLKEQKQKNLQIKHSHVTLKIWIKTTTFQNSIDKINNQYIIGNWSLNTSYKDDYFVWYFSTEELQQKIQKINQSIKFVSSISFNSLEQSAANFAITTYLWNQIVIKMVVKLAQIKKIQKKQKGNRYEYYFHLTYPPTYYINELKKYEASSEKFLKFYERVTNFILLDNIIIGENYFLKYYLFNNSILKIVIDLQNPMPAIGGYTNANQAVKRLELMCNDVKDTIQYIVRQQFYIQKYKLKVLASEMDYKNFQNFNKLHLSQEIQDKIWMIKYLILVMVRFNYIMPNSKQIGTLLKCIQDIQDQKYYDCYLYELWHTATNMWGYKNQQKRFVQFFKQQSQYVKKMNVKNIMKRIFQQSQSIVYIFRVSLTPSGYLFNPPTPQMKGRLLKEYVKYSEFFLRVSIADQNQTQLKNQKYITKAFYRNHMKQVKILGRKYDPLGWSPSQLRSFSLWYFHPIVYQNKNHLQPLNRTQILEFLGDFSKIHIPAKKAARIGQCFSSSWTYSGKNIKDQIIQDKQSQFNQSITFTDGIGKISADLLQKISTKLHIKDLSVIQIRYKGAKGVLALDQSLPNNTIQLRKSMIKYECTNMRARQYLDILDWNKYKSGTLNRQVIILLKTLGINDQVFTRLQLQHINKISKMTFKDCSIFKYMGEDVDTDINNLQPATKTILSLLNAGFQLEKQPFFKGVLETLKKNGYYQLKMKSNILVDQSVRVIGIIDENEILEQGQIYCSIYNHLSKTQVRQIREDERVIITRNPCLDPADIRIVKCVGQNIIKQRFQKKGMNNKYDQLWNVVIMPAKGKLPLTAQISGSDLDGDNFFISWDNRLIPKQADPPNPIDQPNSIQKTIQTTEKLNQSQTYEKLLDFFIDYANYEKLGQIDNSHLIHADRDLQNYAYNQKCRKLAKIHGKAVDFPKTGYCPPIDPQLFSSQYPDFMQKQNVRVYESKSILGKLYRDIKDRIQSQLQNNVYHGVNQVDHTLISDFIFDYTHEQIQVCLRMLRQYGRQITNLIKLIGVDTEYEIYSGNFSTVKDKVKSFGKNRLIATILNIRQRYFQQFFMDLQQDEQKYKDSMGDDIHMKKPGYFSIETRRKAQIYYLVSYIWKFQDIKDEIDGIYKLKKQIKDILDQLKFINNQQRFCGFVWFIIPKVILNLKITNIQAKFKTNNNNVNGNTEMINKQENQQNQEFIQ